MNKDIHTLMRLHIKPSVGYGHRLPFADLNLEYEYDLSASEKGTGPSVGTNLKNENHTLAFGLAKSF